MNKLFKEMVILVILLFVLAFSNVLLRNISIGNTVTRTATYTNLSTQFEKKRKSKKKVKKTKKVKKSKKKKAKKKTYKTSYTAAADRQTYYNYAQSVGGYDNTQMGCLINLWNRESGWNPNSKNKKSGACGIPQALPCSKIKKQQGSNDWRAQIRWGINYVNYRYGSPCNAWNNFRKKGWY